MALDSFDRGFRGDRYGWAVQGLKVFMTIAQTEAKNRLMVTNLGFYPNVYRSNGVKNLTADGTT